MENCPGTKIKKRQVGNIKPVPRSVNNSHSRIKNDTAPARFILHPLCGHTTQIRVRILLPHTLYQHSPPNGCQPQLGLGHLVNNSSRAEVPLVVTEIPNPDISNRETRSLGFGRGRGRHIWFPTDNSSPTPGCG